jgi:hypothetical protein
VVVDGQQRLAPGAAVRVVTTPTESQNPKPEIRNKSEIQK